jgi:predicted nucleotidyltransferase
VRIEKNDTICGLSAPAIREVMRLFGSPTPQNVLRKWVASDEVEELAGLLEREGWFERRHVGGDSETWWETTIRGNALAQARFGRPITRTTAERHLHSVIERAREYNDDDRHIYEITEIVVFGSYLDPAASSLGDLDLAITTRERVGTDDPSSSISDRALAYAEASGRDFKSFFQKLGWAENEVIFYLRNRAPVVSITRNDVRTFTDRWKVVYKLESS